MSCQEFETAVVDLARDQLMEAAARQGALAHVEACPPCAARLAAERGLAPELRALAAAANGKSAPRRVEERLIAEFRRRKRPRLAALGAAAACVLAAVAVSMVVLGRPGRREPQRPAPRQILIDAVPDRVITTQFLPLFYGDNITAQEGGYLVRIRLPRRALASFGLPVSEEIPRGSIHADVLLGEDGLARAVRFVR